MNKTDAQTLIRLAKQWQTENPGDSSISTMIERAANILPGGYQDGDVVKVEFGHGVAIGVVDREATDTIGHRVNIASYVPIRIIHRVTPGRYNPEAPGNGGFVPANLTKLVAAGTTTERK